MGTPAPSTREAADATRTSPGPPLEVGWVLDARLERVDREAVLAAIDDFRGELERALPGFAWRTPRVEREIVQGPREEPVTLLEAGSLELSVHHWDFAIVVTGSDLVSHDAPFVLATPSRALGVAVLSTFRIDPMARREGGSEAERREALRRRVRRLALCSLARLNGLPLRPGGATPLAPPGREDDLDRDATFDEGERAALRAALERVADARVEEEGGAPAGGWRFVLRSVWRNRREIATTLRQGRFWQFPFRLGRLTTAAVSALAVILVTAESWDVSVRLAVPARALLPLAAIVGTSVFVLRRQRLLELHRAPRPTEQVAVTRVSVAVTVLAGVAVIHAALFALALLAGRALFPPDLVGRWAELDGPAGWGAYVGEALFTSAVALLVGSFGASFEPQSWVRHVAYVDEEL